MLIAINLFEVYLNLRLIEAINLSSHFVKQVGKSQRVHQNLGHQLSASGQWDFDPAISGSLKLLGPQQFIGVAFKISSYVLQIYFVTATIIVDLLTVKKNAYM